MEKDSGPYFFSILNTYFISSFAKCSGSLAQIIFGREILVNAFGQFIFVLHDQNLHDVGLLFCKFNYPILN